MASTVKRTNSKKKLKQIVPLDYTRHTHFITRNRIYQVRHTHTHAHIAHNASPINICVAKTSRKRIMHGSKANSKTYIHFKINGREIKLNYPSVRVALILQLDGRLTLFSRDTYHLQPNKIKLIDFARLVRVVFSPSKMCKTLLKYNSINFETSISN